MVYTIITPHKLKKKKKYRKESKFQTMEKEKTQKAAVSLSFTSLCLQNKDDTNPKQQQ